ncbi:hypothetical protein [Rhizobium sp. L1K21]|uniref:hypothetical protein n=1 Tax=Rhizobium sp. L1K21 TaxID=2954933 RepID=UPI00209251D4|nr:hypothetical protein [Rhizobium sp. L1K21]MCO6184599.1 hypothetical protein [Rhizobium sp. L1K21]
MKNHNDVPVFLILLLLLLLIAWYFWREWSKREDPQARAQRLADEARKKQEVEAQRNEILGKAIPPDIQRTMREYLSAGNFLGEEHSPLAYVGYRVGKTNGLASWDRQRRLRVCLQIEIPSEFEGKYRNWGNPATRKRFVAISQHLRMLADMRRYRRNYERAVADWEEDEAWFRLTFDEVTNRFASFGYR